MFIFSYPALTSGQRGEPLVRRAAPDSSLPEESLRAEENSSTYQGCQGTARQVIRNNWKPLIKAGIILIKFLLFLLWEHIDVVGYYFHD